MTRLNAGNTYAALEVAQIYYSQDLIPEWLITKIAHKHYLKMVASHIDTRYINELVKMYPKMEYIK